MRRKKLIDWITRIADVDVLEKLEALQENTTNSISVSISQEEREAVMKAYENAQAGNVRDHEVVMAEMKAKYLG